MRKPDMADRHPGFRPDRFHTVGRQLDPDHLDTVDFGQSDNLSNVGWCAGRLRQKMMNARQQLRIVVQLQTSVKDTSRFLCPSGLQQQFEIPVLGNAHKRFRQRRCGCDHCGIVIRFTTDEFLQQVPVASSAAGASSGSRTQR